MKLNREMWSFFRPYLFIDLKLSEKRSNSYALKSCFFKLVDHFTDVEFNRENFTEYIGLLKDNGHSTNYLNGLIRMIKHIEKWLKLKGYISELNIQDYKYFSARNFQYKDILTPAEIEKLAYVKIKYKKMPDFINIRQKGLILLLGETGCRIGEAISLLTSDISNFPRQSVTFRDTKNKSDRTVPIGDNLYKLLKEIAKENEFVFTSYKGGQLTPEQVNLDYKIRSKATGINKRVYSHLFRHSFCTTMAQAGVSVLDLGRIVGHKSVEVTMRYYNADLEHLGNVILEHPLLKKEMTFEMIKTNLKNSVVKAVGNSKYKLEIAENDKSIKITLNN